MGGFTAQQYRVKHPVTAVVLLCSMPPHGFLWQFLTNLRFFGQFFRLIPFIQQFTGAVDPPPTRISFYPHNPEVFSDQKVVEATKSLVPESSLVTFGFLFGVPRVAQTLKSPVMVIAAEQDYIIDRTAVSNTARYPLSLTFQFGFLQNPTFFPPFS